MSATALIARRPCGCVVGMDSDPTAKNRAFFEASGYTVTEHPISKAQALWFTAKKDCGHGSTQAQLVARNGVVLTMVGQLAELLKSAAVILENNAHPETACRLRRAAKEARALVKRVKGKTPC